MEQLAACEIGIEELSAGEIDEVSGGILCVLAICFGAGFCVGTMLYNSVAR